MYQTQETWRSLDPRQRKLHFWRNRLGHEVDFRLEEAGKFVALEIKASTQVTANDATDIRAFREYLKRKSSFVRGVVLHSSKARPPEDGILALPWAWTVPAS